MNAQMTRGRRARQVAREIAARSGFGDAPLSRETLGLLIMGAVASLLFALTYTIEGVTRPGYDGFQQAISALSLGPGGWTQQVNFVIFGLCTLITAYGWLQALAGGAGSVAYPILRLIEGAGLVVDGFFSQDPAPGYPVGATLVSPTPHGIIHTLAAFACITAIACGWWVLARRFALEPRWRWWALAAALAGVLTIVLIALFGALGPHFAYDGVLERAATGVSSVLGTAILIRLLLMQARAHRLSAR